MDRAEAVKILEIQLDVTEVNTPSCIKLHEALERAIDALKEPTGDYEFFGGTYAKEGDAKNATTTDCPVEDMGEVSDGYHTFNQLYHQRAVLFVTIVNQNKDKAWKSWKHEDGKFCFDKEGEWFIVGVDTPEGSYTYHYEKKYWDMFDCEELDRGKHWDGHTEEDVTRLLSLPPVTPKEQTDCTDFINWLLEEVMDEENWELNAVADGEIICRKLKKLGLLEVKDGYYVRASVTPPERTGEWIPVSERLPKDLEEVVVTWVNRNPPVYYRHEKDKPQTGIAVLYRDTWHWWDSTIVDVLAEYGSRCEIEHISEDIEIIAWMPLPEPYKGGDTE